MGHALIITQALLALAGFYAARWFWQKSKQQNHPQGFALASVVNLAAAFYLTISTVFHYASRVEASTYHLTWIVLVAILVDTAAVITNRLLPSENENPKWEPRQQNAEGLETPFNPLEEEGSEPPYEKHALLVGLREQDLALASKLLSNQGYTVMREDDPNAVPYAYFEKEKTRFTVFFDRDRSSEIPPLITRLAFQYESRVSVIALTHDSKCPRVLREIRDQKFHAAIESPLKATELFRTINSPTLKTFRWTEPYHPNLS